MNEQQLIKFREYRKNAKINLFFRYLFSLNFSGLKNLHWDATALSLLGVFEDGLTENVLLEMIKRYL